MGLGALQPGHLIVILVIVLLIFGPGKLPDLGKAMGEGLRELKKATGEDAAAGKEGSSVAGSTTEPVAASSSTTATATVTPISAASHTCPSCHGSVPAGDKFCGNCGSAMEPVTRSA